ATSVKDALSAVWDWVKDHEIIAGSIAGAIVLAIALRRRRGTAMTDSSGKPKKKAKRSPIGAAFDQAVEALARAGRAREPAATPRELAVKAALPEMSELVELYYAAEWGGRRDPAAERRASELATAIRSLLEQRRKRAA